MPTVSVFSMCLNEIHFIELYLRSNLRFANEIVIIDGGSTDGTLAVLDGYSRNNPGRVKYVVVPQVGEPYSLTDWDTGFRRQWCLDHSTSDYVLKLDIDEIVSDRFVEELPAVLADAERYTDCAVAFSFIAFWRDFQTIRVNDNSPGTTDTAMWQGLITKLWTHNGKVSYPSNYPHSSEFGMETFVRRARSDIDIFHLHYASKDFLKRNDNRGAGLFGGTGDHENPDWQGRHLTDSRVCLQPYAGGYPGLLVEMGFVK